MESIFKVIGTLCITAYIVGLVSNMTEVNDTGKAVRLVCVLVILSSFLTKGEIEEITYNNIFETYSNVDIQMSTVEYIMESVKENIENEIKKELDEKNICYTDVFVHIYKQSNKFKIEKIIIYGVNSREKQYASEIINNIAENENIIYGD